jgi:hypothetical protein
LDGEEGGGEHAGGDVPVPRGPLADLVLREADELLVDLVVLLDLPAAARPCDDLARRGGVGGVNEEVGDLPVELAVFAAPVGCSDLRRTIQCVEPSAGFSPLTSTANAVQS